MSGRAEQRERTKRKVYEAALTVFRSEGVAACRIDDIARLAGVSRTAFYFHFPTKDDVLIARMRETETLICDALVRHATDASLESVLATVNEKLTEIWKDDAALLPWVAGAALRTTSATMSDPESTPLRAELADRFSSAAARGEISDALPAKILGDMYLGYILAGLLAWVGNPEVLDLRSVLDGVTYVFWHGTSAKQASSQERPAASGVRDTKRAAKTAR